MTRDNCSMTAEPSLGVLDVCGWFTPMLAGANCGDRFDEGTAVGAVFAAGGTTALGAAVLGGNGVRKHRCAVNFPTLASLGRHVARAKQIQILRIQGTASQTRSSNAYEWRCLGNLSTDYPCNRSRFHVWQSIQMNTTAHRSARTVNRTLRPQSSQSCSGTMCCSNKGQLLSTCSPGLGYWPHSVCW